MQDAVKEAKFVNGINATELFGVKEAVAENRELAKMQFRAQNKWVHGTNNYTTINEVYGAGEEHKREKPFVLQKDEPLFLLGTDKGANPVEHLLAALAGCLTTTLIYLSALEDVKLDEITSKIEADASVLGFFGIDENIRMGCDQIRVSFDIKSEEPREKVEALLQLAQAKSGVFDTLTNGVPVSVSLKA